MSPRLTPGAFFVFWGWCKSASYGSLAGGGVAGARRPRPCGRVSETVSGGVREDRSDQSDKSDGSEGVMIPQTALLGLG